MKIAAIDCFVVRHTVRGYFRFFPVDEKTGRRFRPSVLVKMVTDDGLVGWGEAVPTSLWSYETVESVVTTIENHLRPALIGREVWDIQGLHRLMDTLIAPSFSRGQPIAKAALDLALHDLISKALNSPLPQLWGRKAKDRITLSWTVNATSLEEAEQVVDEGKKKGYRNFNIKVAPDPAFDVELARLVKQMAPDGFLWADANGGYDRVTALLVAPKLADVGVDVLEQPLPANCLSGYQELKRQGALPIVMDEGIVSVSDLLEFWRLGCLDGVAMKIGRMGGLYPARRCVEILEDLGLLFLGSGLTDPPLSLSAHILLYGSCHLNYPAALNGPQFLEPTPLYSGLTLHQDTAVVPKDPGIGVCVHQEFFQEMESG
ncbi:MAG: mandelate racemase [Armatimonadetes bacterium]|nr:mandelate racemase [Armatimonadota bacterium]MDW8122742.1 enolase C-terminal domain-like protein [Armatimonadota bacterium]